MGNLIREEASAPGFARSGSTPWAGSGSPIYGEWIAAITTFMNTAISNVSAALAEDWAASGSTYSGTSQPATQAPASGVSIPGSCGAGSSVTALVGTISIIRYYFYGRTATKTYRWRQTKPYIPAGDWVYTINPGNSPDLYALAWTMNAVKALATSGPNPGALTVALNAAAQGLIGTGSTDPNGYSFTIQSISVQQYSIGIDWGYSYGHSSGGSGYFQLASEAILGEWVEEYKLGSPTPVSSPCTQADYLSSSDPLWDPATKGPAAKSRMSAITNGGLNGAKSPLLNIGTMCGASMITAINQAIAGLANDGLDASSTAGYVLGGAYHPPVDYSFTLPGSLFTLQTGSSLQGYTESKGAYVLDLHLKKWGKWKHPSKGLVRLTPINDSSIDQFVHTDFGITAGLLNNNGKIYIFDTKPLDSWIRYGKLSNYRLGFCHFLEGRVDFRLASTGSIRIDTSMDGRNLDPAVSITYNYSNVLTYRMYPNIRAKWHTITISGNYDLQYMEFRDNISCRR